MRLSFYWIGFLALVIYAFTLDEANSVYPIFIFVLSFLFAMLVFATLRVALRTGWRNLWYTIRYSKSERAIRERDATTESPLEVMLANALDDAGIAYEREYAISRMHVDFAMPEKKLAVECDGFRYHSGRDARLRDHKRDDELRRRGWTVLRFSGDELRSDSAACVRKIKGRL